jgi:hypothetical protein
MSRLRLASLALVTALLLALAGSAVARALEPVAPARAAEASRIASAALAALLERQRPDGRFVDPTGRVVGGGGLPTVAFAALHADGPGADGRLLLARRTLARGDGATVVLRWPLAMAAAERLGELPPEERAQQSARIASWGTLHAAGVADRCYVQVSCFNNYKLVDAILNLELARSGVHSDRRGTRLADPAGLRRRALSFLGRTLPRVAPATARVTVPGGPTARAALLTDPGALPLAYHAMCTAWAVRAIRLAGPAAPAGLRVTARRALWALVGLAAPDGEVSWSGRGQDQAWTLAAALYAASAGSTIFSASDPALAQRLRRLADIELRALSGRLTDGGLQILPAGNGQLQGLDHYYSGVGSTGLALTFLEMARDELPAATATRAPLPSEVDGGTFSDPARSGLVARRVGRTWLGLRLRRDHAFDPRQDFGVARALRLQADGWHEERPARPAPTSRNGSAHGRAPLAGPALVVGGRPLALHATSWRPAPGGVVLTGAFGGRAGTQARITASAQGVAMQVRCPRGSTLQVTEFLPRAGVLQRGRAFLARGGTRLALPAGFKVRELATRFANARQPSLAAYRIALPCSSGSATIRWAGGPRAAG